MAAIVRQFVSQKKKRWVNKEEEIDLDLSYVTDRIIAMGFPSEGLESSFRNPMPMVLKFMKLQHGLDNVKVYNLCSERQYATQAFPHALRVPFDDHNPCAFEQLAPFCADLDAWLGADERHVAAIHCKAGKGRTGLFCAAYLVHLAHAPRSPLRPPEAVDGAASALAHFAMNRTEDGKGVTIPSQIRWVYYWERYLRTAASYEPKTFLITMLRLQTIPATDGALRGGGCDPFFTVKGMRESAASAEDAAPKRWRAVKVHDQLEAGAKIRKHHPRERFATLHPETNIVVRGNVNVSCFDYDWGGKNVKICGAWFNTAFVEHNHLIFDKPVLDHAVKDKKHKVCSEHFKLEIYLQEVDPALYDDADEPGAGAARDDDALAYRELEEDEDEDDDDEP